MRTWLVVGALSVMAAAGCGGDDGGDGGGAIDSRSVATTATTATTAAAAGDVPDALLRVLRAVPDDPALLAAIDYVDFEAIRDTAGIGDVDGGDRDQASAFARATALVGIPGPASSKLFAGWVSGDAAVVGLDPFTIDREISIGARPTAVAELTMDVDLSTFESYADDLAPEQDGVREFDTDIRNELSRLLIGINALAADEDRLVMGSADTASLVRTVAAGEEVEGSLAGNAQLRVVLEQLGERQRLFVTDKFVDAPESAPAAGQPVAPLLGGIGIDLAAEDGSSVTVTTVVLFADDASARAAASWYASVLATGKSLRNEQPYATLIPGVDITADGPLVVARWTSSTAPLTFVLARDLPFLWTA